MNGWIVRQLDLQQVPSRQNVHEVQEVQWVQAGQSYHPYQQIQKILRGPTNGTKQNLKVSECQSSSKHSETRKIN